ncbi:MAG: ABC transporter permease subunit [Microbacterium sp.]
MSIRTQTARSTGRSGGSVIGAMGRDWRAVLGAVLALVVAALALVGPLLATGDPDAFAGSPYQSPSGGLPLGTDVLGRDVLTRLLLGGQAFLFEGILAAVVGVGVGVLLGILIGVLGGRAAQILRFCSDSVMVIPQILLVLVVLAAFGSTPASLIGAVALAQVTYTARVVEAATRRVVAQDYYRAARAIGVVGLPLMIGEVLPNIAGVVLVELGVRLSVAFIALASLSYLGFGGASVEWGSMIHDNQGGVSIQPLAVFAPVLTIAVFLIGMNLLRDGLARAITERTAR